MFIENDTDVTAEQAKKFRETPEQLSEGDKNGIFERQKRLCEADKQFLNNGATLRENGAGSFIVYPFKRATFEWAQAYQKVLHEHFPDSVQGAIELTYVFHDYHVPAEKRETWTWVDPGDTKKTWAWGGEIGGSSKAGFEYLIKYRAKQSCPLPVKDKMPKYVLYDFWYQLPDTKATTTTDAWEKLGWDES